MGDRTNIADALARWADAANVFEDSDDDRQVLAEAARLLRADPDTSDELAAEARRLLDRWDALDLSDIVDDARPLIAALLERAVTAEADRDEAERRERTAVNLANYHRGVAREAGRRADAARPPAPTESTPDPPYQPVAGRPTMDLLDRGTDR